MRSSHMLSRSKSGLPLDRVLSLEIARVTERAAVAAAHLRGRGNEKAADQAAVDAMRREMNKLAITGTIVIGEGERDEAPMLYIGEQVGAGNGPKVDIAVDPLEGTTLCAKNMPGAIATMAMAEGGTLLHAPDVYMDKIAIGPGYPQGVVDLDASPEDNIHALAKAKGVKPSEITVLAMDRPRHENLIAAIRRTGAGLRLITDGDVVGIILTTEPKIERAAKMGVTDPKKKFDLTELASGDTTFVATGVTDGALLKGVKFRKDAIETETIIYRSKTRTVRRIAAIHRDFEKFRLD